MINNFKKNTCQDGNVSDKATIALCLAISLMCGDASCTDNKMPPTPFEIKASMPVKQPVYGNDKPHYKSPYFADLQGIVDFGKACCAKLYPPVKNDGFSLEFKYKTIDKPNSLESDVYKFGSDIILSVAYKSVEKVKKTVADGHAFLLDSNKYYAGGFKDYIVLLMEQNTCMSCLFFLKQLPMETSK